MGGAIYNEGSLRVSSSLFIGNIASAKIGRGSGIANRGTLEVEDSAFASNVVNGEYGPSEGGGIYNTGALTVLNSTFYSNSVHNILSAQPWDVAWGGGIANHGTMTVTNSTFYGNRAADSGDGIYNGGIATLCNTIVADNCAGGVTDGGHNLEDANTCGFVHTQSLTNTNPLLGPLGDYGGAVPTTPLLPGSPAIDAGDDVTCPATDTRGIVRPFGPHCDIGAFEADYTVRRLFLPRTRRSGLAVLSD